MSALARDIEGEARAGAQLCKLCGGRESVPSLSGTDCRWPHRLETCAPVRAARMRHIQSHSQTPAL